MKSSNSEVRSGFGASLVFTKVYFDLRGKHFVLWELSMSQNAKNEMRTLSKINFQDLPNCPVPRSLSVID